MKNIQLVLKNLSSLLIEKNNITISESEHIARSIKFLNKQAIKRSQFKKDGNIILKGLETLLEKLKKHEEDLNAKSDEIDKLELKNNSHLELIILLDCMQSRSYSFSEKLEYLHNAYKNLVDNYQFPDIPVPNINKRIMTSNLMLFFNKVLNEKQSEAKKFFGLNTKDINIFSTWSFYPNEHLKNIDSTHNQYISFSFWFFEKQIFYPIAYHEIAHALYKDSKHKRFKLDDDDEKQISQALFLAQKNKKYSKSYLYSIHEDIIADIHAYSMTGESYIHALFYTGFFENLHDIFYKDLIEESIVSQTIIDDESDRPCSKRHNSLTLKSWTTTVKFESFFVRMKVLLSLHEKLVTEDNNTFSDALKGMQEILDLIYPDKLNLEINSFETILNSRDLQKKEYQYSKNFTLLLAHLFKEKILNNRELVQQIKYTKANQKEIFQKNIDFKKQIKKYLTTNNVKQDFIDRYEKYCSLYDFTWDYRYLQKNKKYISSGRFFRLYNITQLKLLNDEDGEFDLSKSIYELTMFKFYNTNKILNILKKDYKLTINGSLSYAFGPFDSVIIDKITTSKNDDFLRALDSKEVYFTKRHALFELYSQNGNNESKGYFDLIISVSMEKEVIASDPTFDEELKKDYDALKDIVISLKDKYKKSQFFISMGYENYLIYFSQLNLEDIPYIITHFDKKHDIIQNMHSSILLNHNVVSFKGLNKETKFTQQTQNRYQYILKHKKELCLYGFKNLNFFNKGNIVLLCKLKNLNEDNIKSIKEGVENIICVGSTNADSNVEFYGIYGVYDLKIVLSLEVFNSFVDVLEDVITSIEDYINDVQIEYQPKK